MHRSKIKTLSIKGGSKSPYIYISWAFNVRNHSVSIARLINSKIIIDIKDSSKTVIKKSDLNRQVDSIAFRDFINFEKT